MFSFNLALFQCRFSIAFNKRKTKENSNFCFNDAYDFEVGNVWRTRKKMKLWVENLLNSTLRAWRWVKHYVALHHVLPSKCITLTTAVDTISKLQNSKKKRERNTFIGWIFPNLHSLKKGKIYLFFETHTHTL